MMKQYMKNKSLFLQKEELLSRIAELFSKKILRPSGVLVFLLITCLGLFSCSKFLEENPKDKLPEDDVYNTISEVYLNAVASLYTYVGGYSDSQGLQGTGRGVYDLNTFTSDEAIIPTRGGDWYDGGFWQGLYLHDWGIENDAIQATWEYLYKVVMLSNKSLERIDKFAETHSATELPAYRAEVRAMRAMYYYYLMDLFGRIPLVQSSSVAMKDVVQSERKTVFDFVVKEVLEYLPWKVSLDITDTPYEQTAGARMKKYEVDPTATKDGKLMENDIVLFRYADALLMKSEAKVRNGANGDEELNEVRSRVNASPRTATLENILAERQLELAWEGWRRQDLVRFGKFTRAYSSRPQLPDEASGYTTVFPIPEKIRVMNERLKQNPGY